MADGQQPGSRRDGRDEAKTASGGNVTDMALPDTGKRVYPEPPRQPDEQTDQGEGEKKSQ